MNTMARATAVPGGRLARLARLGSLATGVAGGMIAEGARQLAAGKRPTVGDLVLTPANARRVADQLAQLRGAAMKVGQLMSMDAGNLLPPELAAILARLREDARTMPMSQVVQVLETHWGQGWEQGFERFSFTPCAAASIGQVHRARTHDGQELAIKLQYPGVRRSIDSDVDNVATLLRVSGLLPRALDLAPLLEEAKRQLHEEADYLREAGNLQRFAGLLGAEADFVLPAPVPALTRSDILAMQWVEGVAVESLDSAAQPVRDRIAGLLIGLLFRELFEFGLVQTDPNFANYRYDAASGRIVLLDFGATRAYSMTVVDAYRRLMSGAIRNDPATMSAAAQEIGYFQEHLHASQRDAVIALFAEACEPLRHDGAYDFGASDLARRIRDAGLRLSMERDFWHTPPADALFLHRKLGGLYLLAARLGARVPVGRLAAPYLERPPGTRPA
ncbi:ABC1 kinase family protein [Thauera mechernichensis]|uniref:ABC1 kinase family protein n=1 Tax=Thauera mechernichensis TaxID=82788 RepID=A0ABW3WDC5_9RHOO|nr:AarF/ABC1/UbiB kinase family protein [Thauera mechernichensis]MDG3065758.1 AarF/ABC1/UbiB kinase family protein [Thauera mechernichensis]